MYHLFTNPHLRCHGSVCINKNSKNPKKRCTKTCRARYCSKMSCSPSPTTADPSSQCSMLSCIYSVFPQTATECICPLDLDPVCDLAGQRYSNGQCAKCQGVIVGTDMEFVKKFTQARFLKTEFYPKVRKS